MQDRGLRKTATIKGKTETSHNLPVCHGQMIQVLGSECSSEGGVDESVAQQWPLTIYYIPHVPCGSSWANQQYYDLILMPKYVCYKWKQLTTVAGTMSGVLEGYCAPFVHFEDVSGAELGNGAQWIHGTWEGRHRWWGQKPKTSVC